MDSDKNKPFAKGGWKVAGFYETKMAELPEDDV
jgi:hypothetical protein